MFASEIVPLVLIAAQLAFIMILPRMNTDELTTAPRRRKNR